MKYSVLSVSSAGIEHPSEFAHRVEKILNDAWNEGWELVNVFAYQGSFVLVMQQ